MPPNYNEILEESIKKAQELEKEIEKFKNAVAINDSAGNNLNSITESIKKISQEIKPFTTAGFKSFKKLLIILSVLNTAILVVLAAILFLVK